ncbi:MAG: cyclic-di-AMP receptor [Oscillospiraceae bacterium]
MKLIVVITNKTDATLVTGAMAKAGYASTVTNSYGGFSNKENAVIFSGVDDNKVQSVLRIIGDNTDERIADVSEGISADNFNPPTQVKIGGAIVFVLDVEQFARL